MDLFITTFPGAEGRWQISTNGGRSPVWSRSGELFFAEGPANGRKRLMAVAVRAADRLSIGQPRRLFDLPEDLDFGVAAPSFDVTADGRRLLFVRARRTSGQPALRWVLVQNWPEEFAR